MSTADKLLYLQYTKSAIKDAIIAKGVSVPVGTPFRDYATKIGSITTGSTGSETADEWVRPTEWLALPDNVDGVQKVSILNAVFDTDSEFVAFTINLSSGIANYIVDWGDGTTDIILQNKQAEHKYDYNNINLNSDTVTNYGYKQCVITITPQTSNITGIVLNSYHSSIGNSTIYDLTTGFLDIRINALSCTAVLLGLAGSYVRHTMLEQCLIGELAVTLLNNLFYDCYVLQSVSIKDTSNVTNFSSMHYNNYALQKMPVYTFRSEGVNVDNMFNSCYALRETYPIGITPSINGAMTNMFGNCKSMKYIDLTINSNINYGLSQTFFSCLSLENIKLTQTGTGKINDLSYAFTSTRLKESPIMDTSLCISFISAFQSCDRLTKLHEYDYSSAVNLYGMLNGCYSLKSVPNFNITSRCINLNYLCYNCWSLEKAPTFSDSSRVTDTASMLQYCKSITTIPSYIFGNITGDFTYTFSNMDSLKVMPNITVGSVYTANSNILINNYSLKRMLMPLRFTFSVANAKMSATALNEMYSILPIVTGQTVTVTGNYGTKSDDPTIATAKGWTVIG